MDAAEPGVERDTPNGGSDEVLAAAEPEENRYLKMSLNVFVPAASGRERSTA